MTARAGLITLILCLSPSLVLAADAPKRPVAELSQIESSLAPYREATGKKRALMAVETAQAHLEPLLKAYRDEIRSSPELMRAVLRVGAILCEIDPSYHAVEFVLDLKEASPFSAALQSLPSNDRKCLRNAIHVLETSDSS